MKYLYLFLLLALTIRSSGQTTSAGKSEAEYHSLRVGVVFSPDYCYRLLTPVGNSSQREFIDSRDKRETGIFGYTAGIDGCYRLNSHLGIETGLLYSRKGYQTIEMPLHFANPEPNLPLTAQWILTQDYLDMPLLVNFSGGTGRLHAICATGLTINYMLGGETVTRITKFPDGSEKKRVEASGYEYKPLNLSATIGAGIEYKAGGRIYLRAMPVFRCQMLSIIDAPVGGHLWTAGVNMGLYLGL